MEMQSTFEKAVKSLASDGQSARGLTEEEEAIVREIKSVAVDRASVAFRVGQTILSEIYPARKLKLGKYSFAYDMYIDESALSAVSSGMTLRFVTEASGLYGAPEAKLVIDSRAGCEAIVLLSSDEPYFADLETASKIRAYLKKRSADPMSEGVRVAIEECLNAAQSMEEGAKGSIEKAITGAAFYIYGEKAEIAYGGASQKLDEALKLLVQRAYSKRGLVNTFYGGDEDIKSILAGKAEQSEIPGSGTNNEFALAEISEWLKERLDSHLAVSMGDVQRRFQAMPYGWREVDIAALAARLIAGQEIAILVEGELVGRGEERLTGFLRGGSQAYSAIVSRRIDPSEEDLLRAARFLRGWLGEASVPEGADGLIALVRERRCRRAWQAMKSCSRSTPMRATRKRMRSKLPAA